jgi:hypothetical protein
MSSQACIYCEHLLPPGPGATCPNCGAPQRMLHSLPTLPFPTQPMQPSPLLGAQVPARHTAGVLGSRPRFDTALAAPAAVSQPPDEAYGAVSSRCPASLRGRVDTPPTRSSVDVSLEWWSQGMLRLFFPPLFHALSHRLLVIHPEMNTGDQQRLKSTMAVFTIRVRREDQSLGEARLEGDLIAGEPSLGDDIALYGHYRGSTLIVKEGYNLSFHPPARIAVRPPLPLTRTRLAAGALAALLLTLFGLFLSLLPLFSYHAGSAHAFLETAQYLRQQYLLSGSAFGVLAVVLFSLSGWLTRCVIALLVAIILLAVYMALGGAGLPPLPSHF